MYGNVSEKFVEFCSNTNMSDFQVVSEASKQFNFTPTIIVLTVGLVALILYMMFTGGRKGGKFYPMLFNWRGLFILIIYILVVVGVVLTTKAPVFLMNFGG